MAAYKLRVLTSFLFLTQQQNSDLHGMTFPNDQQAKWLEAFPNETAFPEHLYFIPNWDLLEASNNVQKIRVEARMASNINPQVLRITTAAFCDAVGLKAKMLMSNPLSEKWPSPRFRKARLSLGSCKFTRSKMILLTIVSPSRFDVSHRSHLKDGLLCLLKKSGVPCRPNLVQSKGSKQRKTALLNLKMSLRDSSRTWSLKMIFTRTFLSPYGRLRKLVLVVRRSWTFQPNRETSLADATVPHIFLYRCSTTGH